MNVAQAWARRGLQARRLRFVHIDPASQITKPFGRDCKSPRLRDCRTNRLWLSERYRH